MSKESQRYREMLWQIFDSCSDDVRIRPSWLATEAMVRLDGEKKSPPEVYRLAHLQLCQIARSICAQRFEEDEEDTEQHSLFPNLQKRYPAARSKGQEPEYVQLEHMKKRDFDYNIRRLRREGRAKLRHADALQAHAEQRFAA